MFFIRRSKKLVEQLKEEGKEVVIGPKAHWRGPGGRPLRNEFKDDVGVYIVRQKEEKEIKTENEPAE